MLHMYTEEFDSKNFKPEIFPAFYLTLVFRSIVIICKRFGSYFDIDNYLIIDLVLYEVELQK